MIGNPPSTAGDRSISINDNLGRVSVGVGEGVGAGEGVGEGEVVSVKVGDGEIEGVAVGTADVEVIGGGEATRVGEADGVGRTFLIIVPLSQISFLPLLIQVNFFPT